MENQSFSKKAALMGGAIIILAVLFYFGGLFGGQKKSSDDGRLTVITTFFPLYDFTRNIAGDRANIDILFFQTPEVSSFTPTDVEKINNADMLIKNGAGFEPVLDDLLAASDNKDIVVVDTSVGVALLKSEEEEEEGEHEKTSEESEEGGHAHGSFDPHIWLDPQNAIVQVENIRDALALHDPENREFYETNAEAYIRSLRELDNEIRKETTSFRTKDFIAFHPAFIYFSEQYGLHQVAAIEEFPGKEPSPRYLAEVMDTIHSTGVTVIFSEPQFSPKIVDQIAADLEIAVRILDPVETGDPNRDSYVSIMKTNLETLKEAMK
ncbi:zinc ABC transporter substrate-binding protein [bacterium]|nr:zinc ABC transporter substrate-binding protein [bacterium]